MNDEMAKEERKTIKESMMMNYSCALGEIERVNLSLATSRGDISLDNSDYSLASNLKKWEFQLTRQSNSISNHISPAAFESKSGILSVSIIQINVQR
jgi:hypothetical protein